MNYIRKILYEMKTQRLITLLTIAGTAIAIFLVMTDILLENVHTVKISPESERDRIFYGENIQVVTENSQISGGASLGLLKDIYANLDGVERVSYSSSWIENYTMTGTEKIPISAQAMGTDAEFWKIYDYNFEEGAPFDSVQANAGQRVMVITRGLAEKLFGKGSVVGKTMELNKTKFTVVGVISDTSPIMYKTGLPAFAPLRSLNLDNPNPYYPESGSLKAVLLAKPGVSRENLQKEVKKRFDIFNKKYEKEGKRLVWHQQPYDAATLPLMQGTNNDPKENDARSKIILYGLMLLIPAINLSGMTQSRLRKRVSEFGLQRAIGCSRAELLSELLIENLILTFIGTLAGVILSFIFCILFSNYFINFGTVFLDAESLGAATPTFRMLFSWSGLALACGLCFILNVLSAGIPAWKASGITPAEALSGHEGGKN